MKRRIHPGYLIVILIGFIVAGACAPYYVPGRVPTPQFDSTRDIYAGVGYGAGGLQAEAGVSPMNHLWLSGHFSYLSFTDSIELINNPQLGADVPAFLGQIYGEFGIGPYFNLQGGQLSFLGGYGRGRSSVVEYRDTRDTTGPGWSMGGGTFETYFMQAAATMIPAGSEGYIGVVLRSEYLQFRDFGFGGRQEPRPTALLIGPRVYAGTSLKALQNLRFEMQLGLQIRAAGSEEFRFQPFHFSIMCIGLLDLF